jgi:cation transport regulator ChaB
MDFFGEKLTNASDLPVTCNEIKHILKQHMDNFSTTLFNEKFKILDSEQSLEDVDLN